MDALEVQADIFRTGIAITAVVVGRAAEIILRHKGTGSLFTAVQGAFHAIIALFVCCAAAIDRRKFTGVFV